MASGSAQYDGSLRKQEEMLVQRSFKTLGGKDNQIKFATEKQMKSLENIYNQHVDDKLGPISTVALPIAHNPEHVGSHVAVVAHQTKMNEAIIPAGLMGRASLNHIPYGNQLSVGMIKDQLSPAITQKLQELEFDAAKNGDNEGVEIDPETGKLKQDWMTRFPPGSEFRFGTVPVRDKHEDGTNFVRPGYALYLKTSLPPNIDAAIRMKGRDSATAGELAESQIVQDAKDYADRNHRRVLHEVGQVIRESLGADHALFVTADDQKADIGPHDLYPKMASPTGPTMSLNEIKSVDKIGAVLYHSATTDAKGDANILVGDYHQPILLITQQTSTSKHPQTQIDNTPRTNQFLNAFPSTTRPLTAKEADRAKSMILGNRSMFERVQNSFSPMYTPSKEQADLHAHANEIRQPRYVVNEETIARHTRFHPLSDAHEKAITEGQLGKNLKMGSNIVSIEPIVSVANVGVLE